jgi:hypothetical protein
MDRRADLSSKPVLERVDPGDSVDNTVTVRRMWPGGPLRQWSDKRQPRAGNWIAHAAGGYVGAYLCGGCQAPCNGVYFVQRVKKWLCGACKKGVRATTSCHRAKTEPEVVAEVRN